MIISFRGCNSVQRSAFFNFRIVKGANVRMGKTWLERCKRSKVVGNKSEEWRSGMPTTWPISKVNPTPDALMLCRVLWTIIILHANPSWGWWRIIWSLRVHGMVRPRSPMGYIAGSSSKSRRRKSRHVTGQRAGSSETLTNRVCNIDPATLADFGIGFLKVGSDH